MRNKGKRGKKNLASQLPKIKESVKMDIPCLSLAKCLQDTLEFLRRAAGGFSANTPLWELSMLHRGSKFQRRYTEIMRLFPTFPLFLAPCFTRPALISRPYIMSMEVLAAGGAQFLAPRVLARLLFYRCTTRRYCFRCCRSLSSMFVTLIAFLLRAHVNSLLFYEMQTFVYLGQFEINWNLSKF